MKGTVLRNRSYSLNNFFYYFVRKYSTKVRIAGELPTTLLNEMESNTLKPRHHPGIIKQPFRSLPPEIKKSIIEVIGDTPIKQLLKDGKHFGSYLSTRQAPMEESDLNEKKSAILRQVESSIEFNKETPSEEELKHYNNMVKSKALKIFKERVYNWTAIDYSYYMGLVYLMSRATCEFTTLTRVFTELKLRDPNFTPKTVFDFGSGVGTVIWALESIWKKTIQEYYCVDASVHMNDISSKIIQKSGYKISERIFHRQFLPATYDRKYDIVVSAYSLLELPSLSNRLQTLHNLWNKTSKYLILVERGSNAYFKVINEAREFILMNSRDKDTDVFHAHIIAPCPHEYTCPRIQADNTPCNFNIRFTDDYMKDMTGEERFTYIIFAKGLRDRSDEQWPRIVRPVMLRSRHAICKLCTNSGRLEQITFSPTKPNKMTYRCAKSSSWGDILPVDIKYVTKTDNNDTS